MTHPETPRAATILPPGPLMIDIAGPTLTDGERARLCHPLVGGLILFARNYRDPEQLAALCAEVHALREPPLLIAIDHEGGRVQRCRDGFTPLPPMRRLGDAWAEDPHAALAAAHDLGFVLAAELRACGVDLSFTPVLDLDWGRSSVIGDRAFAPDPQVVCRLAGALIGGLHEAGMVACGKHFPGHGWVEADSHVAIPVDDRPLAALQPDLAPFRYLPLDAVMPAHVTYPEFDEKPAGFSTKWIEFLRNDMRFHGVVFSDDLSMEGAGVAGDISARASAAARAGCDMLLVCNAPDAVAVLLDRWCAPEMPGRQARIAALRPRTPALTSTALAAHPRYRAGVAAARRLTACG